MTDALLDEIRVSRRRPSWSERLVSRTAGALDRRSERRGEHRSDRRSFLARAALVGSAVAVAPRDYVLRPVSALDAVCGPAAECSDGWTVFCCTVNNGRNQCPPGSIVAGWWKNETTAFCGGGPRYIIDCNAACTAGGCDSRGFCSQYGCSCRCHDDPSTCDHRRHCCNMFRYGQCHQEIGCVGPVVCRVALCVPPWEYDASCTTTLAVSPSTNQHDAPCNDYTPPPPPPPPPSVHKFGSAEISKRQPPDDQLSGMDSTPTGRGYWVLGNTGRVYVFGDAKHFGDVRDVRLPIGVRDIARTRYGRGYWILAYDGRVFPFGSAQRLGGIKPAQLTAPAMSIATTASGLGYWILTADGRVWPFGDAVSYGELRFEPRYPATGIARTPSGEGYWITTSFGRVRAFGDAEDHGSLGSRTPPRPPVVAMAAGRDGQGYWLLRQDGKIHALGRVVHLGDLSGGGREGKSLDITFVPTGRGYWVLTDH